MQLDLPGEAAFLGLGGHLDALAGHVELPAVIGAAQAALLVAAEPQRDAAMGAELVDQAVAAAAVAERDQPLGQQLHPHRRAVVLGQLLGQQRRHPVAAEQLAHRRPRTGLGDEIVLFLPEHSHPPALRRALVTVATNSLRSPGRCLDLDQIRRKSRVGDGWKVGLARASGARAVSTELTLMRLFMRGLARASIALASEPWQRRHRLWRSGWTAEPAFAEFGFSRASRIDPICVVKPRVTVVGVRVLDQTNRKRASPTLADRVARMRVAFRAGRQARL